MRGPLLMVRTFPVVEQPGSIWSVKLPRLGVTIVPGSRENERTSFRPMPRRGRIRGEIVRLILYPADDIGRPPSRRGKFKLSFTRGLSTQPSERHQSSLRQNSISRPSGSRIIATSHRQGRIAAVATSTAPA